MLSQGGGGRWFRNCVLPMVKSEGHVRDFPWYFRGGASDVAKFGGFWSSGSLLGFVRVAQLHRLSGQYRSGLDRRRHNEHVARHQTAHLLGWVPDRPQEVARNRKPWVGFGLGVEGLNSKDDNQRRNALGSTATVMQPNNPTILHSPNVTHMPMKYK